MAVCTMASARAARVTLEGEIEALHNRRKAVLAEPIFTLDAHQSLEHYLTQLDQEEQHAHSALAVLLDEEAAALGVWQLKKQDVQVLDKLKELAVEEWKQEESRREQAELDEWSVTRRAA